MRTLPHLRRPMSFATVAVFAAAAGALGCATQPLYPARPVPGAGAPIADPSPSKVVIHAALSSAGLRLNLEQSLPREGAGTFQLRGDRKYTWKRGPLALRFSGRRVDLRAPVVGGAELPLVGVQSFPLEVHVTAEPVIAPDYRARLQDVAVEVASDDVRIRAVEGVAGILEVIRKQLAAQVEGWSYDLRPIVAEAYARIARPLELPLGDAKGCAELRITGVEAAPTVLADGVEKDLAIVVAPSVTLPCAAPAAPPPLPPLANVAMLATGPFTVTMPIAARYEELARAMKLAFTGGKLYFSKEFPELYLADPDAYAAGDQLVLKLRLAGPIKKGPIRTTLDGDIYFAGHPAVVDNELRVPDLQPTIDTSSFLLKLKAALDGDSIRDQAREALRLDLGERLRAVKAKLSTDLSFGTAESAGCLRADVPRIAVSGVYPHAAYIRLYVELTAQAAVYLPCPKSP